jgi:hypothetical protein
MQLDESRIKAALPHLKEVFPDGDWDVFFVDGMTHSVSFETGNQPLVAFYVVKNRVAVDMLDCHEAAVKYFDSLEAALDWVKKIGRGFASPEE